MTQVEGAKQEAKDAADEAESENETPAENGGGAQVLSLGWTQLGDGTTPNGEGGRPALADMIRYPGDVADLSPDEEEIVLVGTAGQKITHIGNDFSRHLNPNLKQLIIRSHLVATMEGLENFTSLDLLELYDNQVHALECLGDGENGAPGRTLRVLDMSYNVIRDMSPVALCPNLKELYLANNKLKSMDGLKDLVHLKKIDLGANRIRVMDPEQLCNLRSLEELWIGKNKIEKIEGLENCTSLRRLDLQSNRLETVENLSSQNETLEELYLAHNGITAEGAASSPTGLSMSFPNLSVLDLGRNRLTTTAPFAHLGSLDELWLSGNQIESFDEVKPLTEVVGQSLDTIYLEYNPLQEDPLYRKKVKELIPSLSQIDANMITASNLLPAATKPAAGVKGVLANKNRVPGESDKERLRRLQDMAVERAKAETAGEKESESTT